MTKFYQDFVGLNTFVYETVGYDADNQVENSIGEAISFSTGKNSRPAQNTLEMVVYSGDNPSPDSDGRTLKFYKNYKFPYELSNTASFFNALMTKRNGPYGYSTWRQIRTSNNPLTRRQRLNNVFTYVTEPGNKYQIEINNRNYDKLDRFGSINVFNEPVVVESYKPVTLIGGMKVYNAKLNRYDLRTVEIKTSLDNEMAFFANDEINRYYETIDETHENYEELKGLYLNDGLDDDVSPIDEFNLLLYKQTVWPKQQNAYLNKTRSRTFFVNKFWRDRRTDRTETDVDNGFGTTVPSQSMWPLDVAADWATRGIPPSTGSSTFLHYIGGTLGGRFGFPPKDVFGFNTGDDLESNASSSLGGSGILMNSYSQFTRGDFDSSEDQPDLENIGLSTDSFLSAACYYASRHTLNPQASVVAPSGMDLNEVDRTALIATASLFEGLAAWDAGTQAGKEPFYDSYEDYARNIRIKGKGYSIVPEFRISSHVAAYETLGVTEELKEIFEISGGLSENTTTDSDSTFYEVLSNSDFLKSFDLIKKDHQDFTKPSVLTLKCKAIKKFLPYEGFYPAQRTTQLAQQFYSSYGNSIEAFDAGGLVGTDIVDFSFQALQQPLFAPGALFNTIKAGVACDYPIIYSNDSYGKANFENAYETGSANRINTLITGSALADSASHFYDSIFSDRVPFEALIEPERFLANKEILLNEPHAFGLGDLGLTARWDGAGDDLYVKMANNFLAETPEFFLRDQNFTNLSSLESSNPEFGNAESGSFYVMRVKMWRSRNKPNDLLDGLNSERVMPPQDLYPRTNVRESFTMYSRASAFGPPLWAGGSGSFERDSVEYTFSGSDSMFGYNFPYTPPYYHGEAWCDLIFAPTETKKYTLSEILQEAQEYPYYSRFWWPQVNDARRDLCGVNELKTLFGYNGPYENYSSGPWEVLCGEPTAGIRSNYTDPDWNLYNSDTTRVYGLLNDGTHGPQHPSVVNFNAMQLKSSVNLFGKGILKETNLDSDGTEDRIQVFSEGTDEARSRWVIQTKFETPMLNFNKYTNLDENSCTKPTFASESVPRGMWHQYGESPSEQEGVYLQVDDIPLSWMKGALNLSTNDYKNKVKSLADLCGFDKNPVKLGQVGEVKEISEAVVAVPFTETDGVRNFFTIPRRDIDDTLAALRREVEPGVFVAGGPPKVGETIIDMVKKMRRYVFPPSMDFVRYNQIQPFAMYVFEFKHNLSKKDLADIWQNLPPDIGTSFDEAEASISHELLAHELLGGGSVIKDGQLDENAEGNEIPSNIQWMIFKVKRRAKTKYKEKVIQNTGRLPKPALQLASEREEDKDRRAQGEDPAITYNWPYDFFSLVELVKIDAEITFSDIENDDKGNKTFKKISGKGPVTRGDSVANQIDIAVGRKKKVSR
jgi:hypothetical protein